MEKVALVTGGAGYVGAHTCKALAGAGWRPVVFDSLIRGHRDFVRWGPLFEGDLLDGAALRQAFAECRPDAVLHFAAFADVAESVRDPGKYWQNNVVGSLNLLTAMREFSVNNLVFSSTCATYGIPQVIPIPETHSQEPINPYGFGKLAIERMMAEFAAAHHLRFLALRYFNAAGADPDCEIGEHHSPETHLIPLIFDSIRGRRQELTIFGRDYPTHDGTCVRDYVHVSDLADAHVHALEYLFTNGDIRAINLGNGRGYSVSEVVESAQQVTQKSVPIIYGDRRPGDPPQLVGSADLARKHLRWTPRFSRIEQILEHAWRWHLKRFP